MKLMPLVYVWENQFIIFFLFILDINECHNNSSGCHENAICINTDGSYTCQCKDGYVGNGARCSSMCQKHESHHCTKSESFHEWFLE